MVLATALGLRFDGGVVLAADRRVSYNGFILSKSARKVFLINERVGVSTAGLPGDFQELVDVLKYNITMYELENEKAATPTNVAKLLSILLYQGRFSGIYYAELVVGGIDNSGPKIFVLDPAGGLMEENFSAVGSGAQIATGILERFFKEGMSEKEAVELAERAMREAISRDALSGDGIDLLIITSKGSRMEFIPVRTA
ncbi:proteasome subunit beta [Candidatus Korarchaeum cryptofilum]|uniref:Proteasome subunit beta 2 n=2 Tax=Candidatus Korarchaeum cryptofilum TaxID=498846 RepID=PSB2_KORCO|nr:proteasome subunit beta [Candidatus Korarchaeum cryptofilum]B1L6X8.1 RecName: Full=Proteasome subunit beta 2; AltName: Full=20S proteasome beta subunit 2; AltName: Full=Proteasome core protein PsmB 2; Flags: Precursor [Candidatus Korarchaeum cryptofilum OPF8]ACB08207.1 Proteasome endopeptidase complex [Candidatus Korarchaeum cryptofilum OPF8]RSN70093.1 proteasome subunit beta [Candidatus Korarchaeum cryptofilum]